MIDKLGYDFMFGYTNYEVICDECGDSIEIEAEDLQHLITEIKTETWRITKEGGHLCPDCR